MQVSVSFTWRPGGRCYAPAEPWRHIPERQGSTRDVQGPSDEGCCHARCYFMLLTGIILKQTLMSAFSRTAESGGPKLADVNTPDHRHTLDWRKSSRASLMSLSEDKWPPAVTAGRWLSVSAGRTGWKPELCGSLSQNTGPLGFRFSQDSFTVNALSTLDFGSWSLTDNFSLPADEILQKHPQVPAGCSQHTSDRWTRNVCTCSSTAWRLVLLKNPGGRSFRETSELGMKKEKRRKKVKEKD